ncbi:toxin-activating lysine-acyltransferase [Vibrio maritimus]
MNNVEYLPINNLNTIILETSDRVCEEEPRLLELSKIIKVCTLDNIRRNISGQSLVNWLEPAIFHNQYKLVKGPFDRSDTGYIIWAWLDDNDYEKYCHEKRFNMHRSRWNEGTNLVIVDVCLPYDFKYHYRKFVAIKNQLSEQGIKTITYCQRDEMGEISGVKKWIAS